MIDLEEQFGQRYKIGRDPAYWANYGPRARIRDPWFDIILCRHGEISPWGKGTLAAGTRTNGPVATKLRRAEFCQVVQDGDDGVIVTFGLTDLSKVARIMQPRRARKPSAKQLAQLRRGGIQPAVKAPKSARPCEIASALAC